MNQKLKTKLKKLPQKSGVYAFKNKDKKIVYLGKALNLKSRVKSYWQQKPLSPKTKLMVSQVVDFDIQVTSSEFEALLLEAKLIKEHKPKYNSRLKDDKRYLYLAITKAPFRVLPVRRPELEKDLLDWFGPFPSSRAVKEVMHLLRRIFPYCSCRNTPKRQCLYFHLKLCPGFKNLSSREYRENINQIREVLRGKSTLLLRNLKRKMNQAAKELEFEKAQNYKNQIAHLNHITQGWRPMIRDEAIIPKALLKLRKILVKYEGISPTTLNKIEGYDVSNLSSQIIVGAMATFLEGQPEKGLYRKFKINYQADLPIRRTSFRKQNDPGSIKQLISRRLNHPEWLYPQLILVDGGKPQVSAAFKAIVQKGLAGKIAILGLAKKEETIVVPKIKNRKIVGWKMLHYSPHSSARRLLEQIRNESHRFAQKYYQTLHLKKIKSG